MPSTKTLTKTRSNRGRKPITYDPKELERDPMITIAIGELGVGKTYQSKKEIERYRLDHPEIGKKGRKVLAFDTNDDDYPEFKKTINPDYLKAWTNVDVRRIRPFNKNGMPMADEDKREVVKKIHQKYTNGLLVLDDSDHYMVGMKGQSMMGALCTVRHRGIDLLLTHQSLAKVSPSEWENCTWLRLHHQVDDATRYKDRIPKYTVVRIAQLIVDSQYNLAVAAFNRGEIDQKEFMKRKSFFVYVNIRQQVILGCSKRSFVNAAKTYVDQEESKLIRLMMNERIFSKSKSAKKGDDLVYKNRNDAVVKLTSEYLRFYKPDRIRTFLEYGQAG